jgi:ABC-type nitrate/sulfonate/bicarbonate transport system substrate-binding protein
VKSDASQISQGRFLANSIAILLVFCAVYSIHAAVAETKSVPVRVGWQTSWATQGQLVMALKHSNIAKLVDTDLDFVGFVDGPHLNQAALAGQVDVLLTADQPAIALLNLRPEFRIVARMMYNRVCLYVPVDSPIQDLKGLKGKSVSGPVGAAAERVALQALRETLPNLGDITFGSLGMAQQAALIRRGPIAGKWGTIDALYGFDPWPAIWEDQGLARNLNCGTVTSVVMASPQMMTERRRELEGFLAGFALAWYGYASEPKRLNSHFSEESRLNASEKALDLAASVEPNRWTNDMARQRLEFQDDDLKSLRSAARFLAERGSTSVELDPARFIDLSILTRAKEKFDLPALGGRMQIN